MRGQSLERLTFLGGTALRLPSKHLRQYQAKQETDVRNSSPETFEYIEQEIRHRAVGTEFGSDFEWVGRFFLLNAPKYKGVFTQIWLWNDWPGRWGIDKGK